MNEQYSLEKSPLYRLRNKRKLADYLKVNKDYFEKEHNYQYNVFSRPKPNGDGERVFTVPPDELKKIQKQVCRLLNRIETPDWVISGKKGYSYITNAEAHVSSKFVKTMDISKFYDSAQRSRIYKMFLNTFKMEHDVAWCMTELVTYKGVLPTGSPSSQLIIYWTYRDMFEEINRISRKNGCIFSLYVDDMTFSSNNPIKKEVREEVACLLKKNDLLAKAKKDHYYQAKDFKVVTGVGLQDGKKIVLNEKRKSTIQLYEQCKKSCDIKNIEKLNGVLCSLRQIEPGIFPEIFNFVQSYKDELKEYSQKRFYRMRRQRHLKTR